MRFSTSSNCGAGTSFSSSFPLDLVMSKPLIDPQMASLYQSIGRAVSHWAHLEQCLSYWFCVISGMETNMANDIFFSANSFKTRIDLTQAAIDNSPALAIDREFASVAVNKAATYSKYRNRIVHGSPIFRQTDPPSAVIIDTYGPHTQDKYIRAITIAHLDCAGSNFAKLSSLMVEAHVDRLFRGVNSPNPVGARPLVELLRLVQQLPNAPDSIEPSQRQKGRARQLQAAAEKTPRKQRSDKGH